MTIDKEARLYHGEVNGFAFTAMPNGDLVCERVSDLIRDEMRLQAATEYLLSARALLLSAEDIRHWHRVNATTMVSNFLPPATRNTKACNP